FLLLQVDRRVKRTSWLLRGLKRGQLSPPCRRRGIGGNVRRRQMTDDVLNRYWLAKRRFEIALPLAAPLLRLQPHQGQPKLADINPGVEPRSAEERKEARKIEADARGAAFRLNLTVRRRQGVIVVEDRSQRKIGVCATWPGVAQAIADYAARRRKPPAS